MTEHQFKILIIGDGNVGKSSFVHRYVNGQFNKNYKMTMGAEFTMKLLLWTDTEKVRLQLWDIAGQERFISMNRIYYKGASGCVVMFDVSNSASLQSCRHWKQDLDNKRMLSNGQPLPCILLANKCDLTERVVSVESIQRFSQDCGFTCWMETSVKDNRNVNEAMRRLVEEILSGQSIVSPVPPSDTDTMGFQLDSVELNGPVDTAGCCTG